MANYSDTTPIVGTQGPGQFPYNPMNTAHNGRMDGCVVQMSTDDPMLVPGSQPKTTAALVMSVLSVVFCSPICALAAIFVSWQARLQVLDQKFAHARHSLVIVWVLLGLSVLFGVLVWIMVIRLLLLAHAH